jgi:hypothetical protein
VTASHSSGNETFLHKHWPSMVAATSYAMTRSLDEETQLFGAPNGPQGTPLSSQKGQALGPASTVSLILGLERMADIADYVGYNALAVSYRQQAALSRTAIDMLLWNNTDGYYASTLGASDYDMMDIAQILLAEIGTAQRRTQFMEKLAALKVPAGYINGTRYLDTPGIIDPYYLSFLLEGLAKAGQTELAQDLLDATWSPMVRRNSNFTGGYWEYVVSRTALPLVSCIAVIIDNRAPMARIPDLISLPVKATSGVATRLLSSPNMCWVFVLYHRHTATSCLHRFLASRLIGCMAAFRHLKVLFMLLGDIILMGKLQWRSMLLWALMVLSCRHLMVHIRWVTALASLEIQHFLVEQVLL